MCAIDVYINYASKISCNCLLIPIWLEFESESDNVTGINLASTRKKGGKIDKAKQQARISNSEDDNKVAD